MDRDLIRAAMAREIARDVEAILGDLFEEGDDDN